MRQFTTLSLFVCFLAATVQAANPVFGAYSTDSCDACLDQTYESCPGDYKTRSYATCMCAGDGSANFVTCLSSCDPNKNEPEIASSTYYGYCVLFFKELCDGAQQFLTDKIYSEQCSKEAIAAGGIGAKDDSDDDSDNDKSKSSDPDKTTDSDSEETDDASETTKTGSATKTGEKAEAAQTSNSAIGVAVTAWAIAAGLAIQLVNV
ncbi:hypothetical protein ACHAPU_009717 [Fusarium lateritium]